MTKYKIEGGSFDFYEELYKSLDENESSDKKENVCLITQEPLKENYVTLNCNHSFNYMPLYKDIKNFKQKFISMDTTNLKKTQIRCPYCRNIQNDLLPYVEMDGVQKLQGINHYDPTAEVPHYLIGNGYYFGVCSHVDQCQSQHVTKCKHDQKDYCYYHVIKMNRQFKKEELLKKKQAAIEIYKAEKLKEKEEKKKEKDAQKAALKAEKDSLNKEKKIALKQKKINAAQSGENVIIDETKCCQLLKSGLSKGQQCGAKIYSDGSHNKYCKRHFNSFLAFIVNENNITLETN
jgi:hypothetical protein